MTVYNDEVDPDDLQEDEDDIWDRLVSETKEEARAGDIVEQGDNALAKYLTSPAFSVQRPRSAQQPRSVGHRRETS